MNWFHFRRRDESESSQQREFVFDVELDREDDGRWIADVEAVPGVLTYGATKEEAINKAYALLLRVVADRLEHDELTWPAPVRLRMTPRECMAI